MILDPAAPVVVVSPHLDDAVLSTFATLTDRPRAVVVNVFCAPPPDGILSLWDRLTGATSSRERAEERLREDFAVLGGALSTPAVALDLLDAMNREAIRDGGGGRVPEPTAEIVAAEIAAAVPRASRILGPLSGSDRPNPDHVLARDAVRLLARGWYGQEPIPAGLYADFPHVCKARAAWPPSLVDGGRAGFHARIAAEDPRWVARSKRELAAEVDPLWPADVLLLNQETRARKLAAMEGYRTQFRALDRKLRTKGLVSDPALYGVEVVLPLDVA